MPLQLPKKTIGYGAAIIVLMAAGICIYRHHQTAAPKPLVSAYHDGPPPTSREQIVNLGGCITLDTSKDSDRFLGCVKDSLDQDHIPYMINQGGKASTTLLQALQNLNSCTGNTNAMVIGHGLPGMIHVNGGDYYVKDRVSAIADLQGGGPGDQPWNESEWIGSVDQHLKNRFQKITLLGCDTGKKQDGNTILMTMATHSLATVTAPKGKVWCDPERHKVILDKADGWSTVTGGGVITESNHQGVEQRDYSSGIGEPTVQPAILGELLASPDVTMSLCLKSSPSHQFAKDPLCPHPLSPAQTEQIVTAIFGFKAPFKTPYISGADRTGSITIMSSANGKIIQFDILNDDLVGELATGTYYHVADSLVNSWKDLMK